MPGLQALPKHRLKIIFLIILFLATAIFSPAVARIDPLKSENRLTENRENYTPANLLEKGKALYEGEKFAEAVKVLQEALNATDDRLQQAIILSNLSLAYQQLGLWQDAGETISQSLDLLENLSPSTQRSNLLAQALDVRGKLELARGQTETALSTWEEAADLYRQSNDRSALQRNRLNQVAAWQALGLYRQAQNALVEIRKNLESEPNSSLKATVLRSLGDVLRVVGNLDESRQVLEQSLAVATALKSDRAMSEALLSLGNTAFAQQNNASAINFYQQAASIAVTPNIQIQADLDRLVLLLKTQEYKTAGELAIALQSQISNLPASRTAVYAKINLAHSIVKLSLKDRAISSSPTPNPYSLKPSSWLDLARLLSSAIEQAQNLQDDRARSYAIGTLGWLYERAGQFSNARQLTEQALDIAQTLDALDLAYQWQWQLGRLLENRQEAIAAYSEAVTSLQSLRNDLVVINPDVQFSFQEEVEPVYRQLVDLLLKEPNQSNLIQARNTIELLQLAELNNFFRAACLEAKIEIDRLVDRDGTAAVIYPIILSDRLEVIVKLPQKQLRHYATPLSQSQVERILEQLRNNLTQPDTVKEAKFFGQQVYEWLIEPIAEDLAQSKIETLVFVLDGSLRNIPMAALYDGQQYLVEKYSIALTPGLQLIDPQPLQRKPLKAIAGGLTEPRSGFSGLKYVAQELEQIRAEMPSQELLNEQFTAQALQDRIASQPFPIVHLATHGQFSSKAEQTFILAWDKPIEVNEFNNLLQTREESQARAIELLVLSACQTAVGDKRAALGLAGVAIRAGARSTIASLWYIDDASTSLLMSKFYQELTDRQLTPAEALRRAQISLMHEPQYKSPLFWAAYVLVGNWL
jgi:CHAT domain-containing protein/predicted negative regulator of RcsB-dependent stress response